MRKPVLLLKLNVVDVDGKERDEIVELTTAELDHFVQELEKAHKVRIIFGFPCCFPF